MLVRELQQLLAGLYGAEPAHDVRDFLVTDRALLDVLESAATRRDIDEKLLFVQHGDGLDMSLYLDARVLERLEQADPRDALGTHNLADFWTVLEGVSHFNYLAWQAGRDQCVTLMELEMQAEVDKYLGTRVLLGAQPGSPLAGALLHCLFELPVLHAALAAHEAERYRDASHLAGRYCHHLERRWPGDRLAPDMLDELRAFYRWPQPAKVSHIRATRFA
jgi:hypothetical protein